MTGFWTAAGGAVVGALIGTSLALLVESARDYRRRQAVLQAVRHDIKLLVDQLDGIWVVRSWVPHKVESVVLFLTTLSSFRSRLEESMWFREVAGTGIAEVVVEFYDVMREVRASAGRASTSAGSDAEWAQKAYKTFGKKARMAAKSGREALEELTGLIATLHWTDWMRDVAAD